MESEVGGGFVGLLTITFIVLKLCGVIAWSWLWVLSPLWITWAIALLVILVLYISEVWDRPSKDRW